MKTGDRQRLKLMHFLEAFCNHIRKHGEHGEQNEKKNKRKKTNSSSNQIAITSLSLRVN